MRRIQRGEETILKHKKRDRRDAGREGEHRGMRRQNRGFGKQQLRQEKKEKKKDSVVDERGLSQI